MMTDNYLHDTHLDKRAASLAKPFLGFDLPDLDAYWIMLRYRTTTSSRPTASTA